MWFHFKEEEFNRLMSENRLSLYPSSTQIDLLHLHGWYDPAAAETGLLISLHVVAKRSLQFTILTSVRDLGVTRNSRPTQSALELGPSHCPNGRLGPDLGFGGFAFAIKLPELLNTNLPTVRSKLGQTSSFPNGPKILFPTGR